MSGLDEQAKSVLDKLPPDVRRKILGGGIEEAEKVARAAMDKAQRVQHFARKKWPSSVLKQLLPAGEDPIATRYDPNAHMLHVACASGKTFAVPINELVAAEIREAPPSGEFGGDREPRHVDDEPDKIAEQMRRLEAEWDQLQKEKLAEFMKRQLEQAQKERERREAEQADCTCARAGGYDLRCPVHKEAESEPGDGGKGKESEGEEGKGGDSQQPPPRSFIDQWEMAQARLVEYALATGHNPDAMFCMCPERATSCGMHVPSGPCQCAAQVLLKPIEQSPEVEPEIEVPPCPTCGLCARTLLAKHPLGMNLLDWDPNE